MIISTLNYTYFGYDKFSAAKNMAIDEILKKNCEHNNIVYIRFYDFEKPAIILSYLDSKDCLRQEAFADPKVEISRRKSGGKPIYIDDNIFAYSIIGSINKVNAEFTSMAFVHKYFGSHIVNAINKIIEINKERISLGDIYSIKIDGKPIAGHAQFPTINHSFFYHGILAIGKWDAERINKLLNLNKTDYETLKSSPCVKDFLKGHDNSSNSLKKIKQQLANAILESISYNKYKKIDNREKSEILSNAETLVHKQYSTKDWIENSSKNLRLKTDSKFCLLYDG